MSRKKAFGLLGSLFSVWCALFLVVGSAWAQPSNVKSVNCKETQIEWDVAPEVEISGFECAI